MLDGLLVHKSVRQQESILLKTDQQRRGNPHLIFMSKILPGRHLRSVKEIAAGPYYTLQQLRDADLPLIWIFVRPNIICHFLSHVLNDLRGDHHVAAIQAAAVVGHLREFSADTENHFAVAHAIFQGGQPNRPAFAQVGAVEVPVGSVAMQYTSPLGQAVRTTWAALHGHIASPCRVPRQVPSRSRGTHLSAVIVPLAVRAGLRVQRAGYWNNSTARLIMVSSELESQVDASG